MIRTKQLLSGETKATPPVVPINGNGTKRRTLAEAAELLLTDETPELHIDEMLDRLKKEGVTTTKTSL